MRRTVGCCIIALVAALVSCGGDAPPTSLSSADGDVGALASDVAGVPDCGFENGAACPVLAAEPRCDRGLQLIGTVPPLHLGGVCVNDTRHLVGAASRGTWVDWALANQRTLAVDEPINLVMHLTTHNAFNNIADGETFDPNQVWSLSDQLDLGSRFLWLDPHWVAGRVRLCHAAYVEKGPEFHVGCGPGDRELGFALKEIATWLAANPEEIIIIDLEAYVEEHTDHVTNALNTFFGSKLYRVADRPSITKWPSRRELRAMGKQVIVGARGVDFAGTTHRNGYLLARTDLRYIKHFDVTRTNGIVTGCLAGSPQEGALQTDEFFRVIGEDRTTLSLSFPDDHEFHVGTVSPSDVADIAGCGVRLISLDMMGAMIGTLHPAIAVNVGKLLLIPNRVPLEDRRPSAVWSWSEGDRGAGGDAALLRGASGRWSSAAPTAAHRFACARMRSETARPDGVTSWPDPLGRQWRITTRSGAWREGGRACLDEFGGDGFVFSVPVHGFANGQLRLADASRGDVWVNYNDVEHEGDWVVNRRPVARAGADQVVECTGHHGTLVHLDARASSDAEGHAITYEWRGPFGTVTGAQPTVSLPVGRHEITLIAADGFGGASSDIVVIDVVDTTPPEIHSVMATPSSLWAPNHKMDPVAVTVDVSDVCDPSPTCRIVAVTSTEPVNGKGDGNTDPDWHITGALTVELRAERSGGGAGRVYTLTIRCTDASGNAGTRDVVVTVAHDQGKPPTGASPSP
jgi:hypothetical protein